MPAKKVLVVTTIECYKPKSTVFDLLNTDTNKILLNKCYEKLEGLKQKALDYSNGDFNDKIDNAEDLGEAINEVFSPKEYYHFIEEVNSIGFNRLHTVYVPVTHLSEKPAGFDYFVGYAVPEELFDIEHAEEHEGIETDKAIALFEAHNQWMRDNADIFDVFIDGKDLEEAIGVLRNL